MRWRIARSVAHHTSALTLLTGDWNWTTEDADRVNKRSGKHTGGNGCREEDHFRRTVLSPQTFVEVWQPLHTHANAHAYSRLDRIYANYPLADQLDRQISSVALEWPTGLSDHRGVADVRRLPRKNGEGMLVLLPLPPAIVISPAGSS